MKTCVVTLIVANLFMLQSSLGQQKHIMDDVMLPVAKDFWSLVLGDKPRATIPGLPTDEVYAKQMLQSMKESVKFSPDAIAKLKANKPIRDSKVFTSKIESWPNSEDNNKVKKRFVTWYGSKKRTQLEKEAMFYMMQFLVLPKR